MLDLTGGRDNLMMGVTSLWLRLCAGETGGLEAQVGDFKTALDPEPKLEVKSGLDNMSGIRPLAMFYAAHTRLWLERVGRWRMVSMLWGWLTVRRVFKGTSEPSLSIEALWSFLDLDYLSSLQDYG